MCVHMWSPLVSLDTVYVTSDIGYALYTGRLSSGAMVFLANGTTVSKPNSRSLMCPKCKRCAICCAKSVSSADERRQML
ncbi:hypothetical protein BCEP27_10909 [Burkholderia cepacia]